MSIVPESSSEGNGEIILSVTKDVYFGGKKIRDLPIIHVRSSAGLVKEARACLYYDDRSEQTVRIQYVDGSGLKSVLVSDLQKVNGNKIRFVFEDKHDAESEDQKSSS